MKTEEAKLVLKFVRLAEEAMEGLEVWLDPKNRKYDAEFMENYASAKAAVLAIPNDDEAQPTPSANPPTKVSNDSTLNGLVQ